MPQEPGANNYDWRILLSAVLCIFALSRVLKFVAGLKMVKGIPGPRVPFCPVRPPGIVLPTISWLNPGLAWVWKWRLSFYKQWRSEFVSFVPFLLGPPVIYTSSLEVTRQVVAGGPQSVWVKPKVKTLTEWGPTLVTANKEDWRRHRRIIGPAFNPSTYSLVWAETSQIYKEIITTEGWTQKDVVTLDPVQAYTTRVAFLVISACGFGLRFQWEGETETGDGDMGIQKAMRIWVDSSVLRVITPSWMYKLPFKRLRDIATSNRVLRDHIDRMILEHKADLSSEFSNVERRDMFSLLVRASEEDSKFKLSDSELVGNVFAMMLAGHETTASTLAATIGFLGVYQNVQEDVYKEIIKVVGHDRDPTFEDFPQLERVAHTFYEAMRLYPPAFVLLREANDDTTLNIPNANEQPGMRQFPVPKGLKILVDLTGIQYNPRYFPDPNTYNPNRWRGVTPDSEEISAFGLGPRTCIGRKFAVVEAVCFLALLVRDWMIEPIMNPGETGEQWRERVMEAEILLTLKVKPFPVRLRRRARAASECE
ncbi:cytochrome P450 [Russula dissimulans]|nr:cytochrome P450 [Russula dissimulans]